MHIRAQIVPETLFLTVMGRTNSYRATKLGPKVCLLNSPVLSTRQHDCTRTKCAYSLVLWISNFSLHLRGLYHRGPKVRLFNTPILKGKIELNLKIKIECTRTMIPLIPGYAVTIHKAQGTSLSNVIINLGKKEFCTGMTYTALSRCKKISNLALDPFPDFVRIRKLQDIVRFEFVF